MPMTLASSESSPLGSNALHGAPHEGVTLKDGIEVVDVEGEHVAVGLRTHTRYPPDDDNDDGDGDGDGDGDEARLAFVSRQISPK